MMYMKIAEGLDLRQNLSKKLKRSDLLNEPFHKDESGYSSTDVNASPDDSLGIGSFIWLLAVLGLISLFAGIALLLRGFLTLKNLSVFEPKHHFRLETIWINATTVLAGVSAIYLIVCRNITSLCALIASSSASLCASITTSLTQAAQLYFSNSDAKYYDNKKSDSSSKIVNILSTVYFGQQCSLSLMIFSLISCLISGSLLYTANSLIHKNYYFHVHREKRSLMMTIIGLAQISSGLLITGLWTSTLIILSGQGVDVRVVLSGDTLFHGLFVSSSGIALMIAMGKGVRPFMVLATFTQGCSLFICLLQTDKVFSLLAFTLDHKRALERGSTFDIRMTLCIALATIYVATMISCFYVIGKMCASLTQQKIPEIRISKAQQSSLLKYTYSQLLISLFYAVLDLIGSGLFVLHKTDFSPLPLLILCQGLFLRSAIRSRSFVLFNFVPVLILISWVYCIREVSLFAYHTIRQNPDSIELASLRSTAWNWIIHLLLAFTAIVEFGVSVIILQLARKFIHCDMSVNINKQRRANIGFLFLAGIQTVASVLLITTGIFLLVISHSVFLTNLADKSIAIGFLACMAATSSLAVACKSPKLVIIAFLLQISLFITILLQVDALSFNIETYLEMDESNKMPIGKLQKTNNTTDFLPSANDSSAYASFGLLLAIFFSSGIITLMKARCLEEMKILYVCGASDFYELRTFSHLR